MTVYSLTASDEPLQVRYVGATVYSLESRLRGHMSVPSNAKKVTWMRQVKARGAKVLITLLSTHETLKELQDAENRWVLFWRQYCDLLNVCVPTRIRARSPVIPKKPAETPSLQEVADAVGHDKIMLIVAAELEYQARYQD